MATLPAPSPAPAGQRCPTCRAPITPTREPAPTPCGHVAFITSTGIVVGWADSVGCALNLERTLNIWREQRAAYAIRYPVADDTLPLGEQDRQNEKTLAAVMRERAARQAGLVIDR